MKVAEFFSAEGSLAYNPSTEGTCLEGLPQTTDCHRKTQEGIGSIMKAVQTPVWCD